MNSRLERLKVTIEKCLKVEGVFAKHHVRGAEPVYYDDTIAGFTAQPRNGFHLNWDLVFGPLPASAPDKERRDGEPTYIEVKLSGGGETDTGLFEVNYLPALNQWILNVSKCVGGDGTEEPVRNLAADCQIGANERRQIGEDEAMKIISTLAAFFMSQPVG